MASSKISLKLLVDTKSKKVLFAEAGKEIVDFVFSLLTLPIGAVVKLISAGTMQGSIGRLYQSAVSFTRDDQQTSNRWPDSLCPDPISEGEDEYGDTNNGTPFTAALGYKTR
ncbi:hypothetical protein EJB05_16210, partial [Eragrostis curvula]